MASILAEDPGLEWVIAAGARPRSGLQPARPDNAPNSNGFTTPLIDRGSSPR
jgi:hypothetical protein